MNWPELLIGALIGAFAQAIVEVLIPGPSVLLSLLRRMMSREDKQYVGTSEAKGRELYWRPHASQSWEEPEDHHSEHPRTDPERPTAEASGGHRLRPGAYGGPNR